MKKIIMSTLAIAMMMTMASCSSSDNDVAENISENNSVKMTFFAIQENSVGTRTTLGGESGKQVIWENGDEISVNGISCQLQSGAGTTTGEFTGYGDKGWNVYLAVYPHKNEWVLPYDAASAPITFPNEQTAKAGSFDKNSAFMIARIESPEEKFEFKNAVALVKVTPKFACQKIELKAKEGDENIALAGKGYLIYNEGKPYIDIQEQKAYSITLNGTIEKDKTYYIAVPTVTLAPGWSISFTDNAGDVYTRTGSNEIEFKRNTIINLGEFSRTDEKLKLTLKENGKVPADKQVDMGVFTIGDKNYRVIFAKSNLTKGGLAEYESGYGDYFAWGAIKPWYEKITSTSNSVTADSWETNKSDGYIDRNAPFYQSGNSVDDNIEYSRYTETGNILEDRDDAAKQILQGNWQVPSATIWQQLYDSGKNTKFEWKWNESNKGYEITNKENNNTIFLPAAGDFWKKECGLLGTHGHYWSNTTLSSNKSIYLYFSKDNIDYDCSNDRYYGFSIRPVRLVAVD